MADKQRRRPLLAFSIATGAFFVVVTVAGLLGLEGRWMALLIFGGLPFLFAFAAIIGLRATDSRMAKSGPGVFTALGPGEIRELEAPTTSTTRLGYRAAWANLPILLPPRRLVMLVVFAAAGAAIGAVLTGMFVDGVESWRLVVGTALFALCGALASAVVPLAMWLWVAHRGAPLPRDTRRMIENSVNPANERIRLNLSRVDEIEQAIAQRRIVFPLLLPLALCVSAATAAACVAELIITSGESFPALASFVWTSLMLLMPLTALGHTEQLALALEEVRSSEAAA